MCETRDQNQSAPTVLYEPIPGERPASTDSRNAAPHNGEAAWNQPSQTNRLSTASTTSAATTPSPPAPEIHLQRLLVPVDFSEPSQKALRYAAALARQYHAVVTLVHAVEPLPYPDEFAVGTHFSQVPLEPWRARLEQLAAETLSPEERGPAEVRFGVPFQVVTDVAREAQTDLIVLSTHGRTGIRRVLLGSTAERVLRHAPCPVLVVREREHEFVQSQDSPTHRQTKQAG